MALLSREQILTAEDRQYDTVKVPEWAEDGEVRLRSLTGEERDAYEAGMARQVGNKVKADLKNIRAKLVALSACDENGQLLFTLADVMKLGSKNAAALDRCFEAAQKLSGISDDDIEELTENFDETQGGPSDSGSPSHSGAAPSPNFSPGLTPANSPNGWPTNGTPGPSDLSVPTSTPR